MEPGPEPPRPPISTQFQGPCSLRYTGCSSHFLPSICFSVFPAFLVILCTKFWGPNSLDQLTAMVKHRPKGPSPHWTKVLLGISQSVCGDPLVPHGKSLWSDRSGNYSCYGVLSENHKAHWLVRGTEMPLPPTLFPGPSPAPDFAWVAQDRRGCNNRTETSVLFG